MNNRRKRWLIALGCLAVLLAIVGIYTFTTTPDRIGTHASRHIQEGMTLAQVEAVLGGPPGDYRTPPMRPADHEISVALPPGLKWQGDRCSIYVLFDARDRVVSITRFYPGPMRPSWYQALQQYVPLSD